jgi:hypothetical protein
MYSCWNWDATNIAPTQTKFPNIWKNRNLGHGSPDLESGMTVLTRTSRNLTGGRTPAWDISVARKDESQTLEEGALSCDDCLSRKQPWIRRGIMFRRRWLCGRNNACFVTVASLLSRVILDVRKTTDLCVSVDANQRTRPTPAQHLLHACATGTGRERGYQWNTLCHCLELTSFLKSLLAGQKMEAARLVPSPVI